MLHLVLELAAVLLLVLVVQTPEPMSTPVYTCPEGGGQIAFSAGGLRLLDTATGEVHTLVERTEILIDHIAWSPDGRHIAFDTSQGGSGGIWIIEVSESGQTASQPRLLFDLPDAHELNPVWSPDGTKIAFSVDGSLYIGRVDGSEPYKLSADVPATALFWSPDGARILYGSIGDTGWMVQSVHVETGEMTESASGEGTAYLYGVSPDGMLLVRIEGEDGHILVVDVVSGGVTDLEVDGYVLAWSPDGTQLAYSTWISGYQMGNEIVVMDKGGENSEIVTEDFLVDVTGPIQWSPDATRIAFDAFHMNYEYTGYVHVLDIETHEVQVFEDAALSDTAPVWRPCNISE